MSRSVAGACLDDLYPPFGVLMLSDIQGAAHTIRLICRTDEFVPETGGSAEAGEGYSRGARTTL